MNPELDPVSAPNLLDPLCAMRVINRAVSKDTLVFVDIGNAMIWALREIQRDLPRTFHANFTFGAMGHAIPAAIGAALAQSHRVVVVTGDGACLTTAGELHTAAALGCSLCVCVWNDAAHGMVELGNALQFPDVPMPSYSFDRRVDFSAIAVALGCAAVTVANLGRLEGVLEWALKSPVPMLLDLHIDPRKRPPFDERIDLLKKNFTGNDRQSAGGTQGTT